MQTSAYIVLLVVSLAASSYGVAVARGPSHRLALEHLRRRNGGFEDLMQRLKTTIGRRCLNTFDDGCINGNLPFSTSDDDWINGGGSPGKRSDDDWINSGGSPGKRSDDDWINSGGSPGKRCINTFDEGCINGLLPYAPGDDSWNGADGGNPGKRCAFNTFDENCANGDLPNGNSDDSWINGGGSPGKR